MPPTATCALAQAFTHTAEAVDLRLTFSSGTSPVETTVPSGTYRMCLAPSASDLIRVVQSRLNTALSGAGRTETVTVSLSAAGVFSLSVSPSAAFSALIIPSDSLRARLGFTAAPASGSPTTADVPVWHLATFIERVSADWSQRTSVATAETESGAGYGVTSGITTWRDEVVFGFVPRDPTYRASLAVPQTAWEPAPAYLTTLGTVDAREFSVSDLLATGIGKTHAYAAGNFQALLSSTTERYHLVTIPGRECGAPRLARLREGWDAYRRWTVGLIRQSTPTGTRA